MLNTIKKSASKISKGLFLALAFLVIGVQDIFAQAAKGVAALNDATASVQQYFQAGINLAYGAAAIIGLIGGVKVYQKWTQGDPDTGKVAGAWLGGAIFLVAVTTVLQVIFIN